jgi:anti-sigma factor ChrR (cupin superfamily)
MEQKEFNALSPLPPATTSPPWILLSRGVWEQHLNGPSPTCKSVLQYWEPFAASPTTELITHDYIEEVIIVQGTLRDETLRQEWGVGAYAYRKPGMRHGPYKAGERGCLMLVRCEPGEGEPEVRV